VAACCAPGWAGTRVEISAVVGVWLVVHRSIVPSKQGHEPAADHSVQARAVLSSGDGHAQDIDLRGRSEAIVAGERSQADAVGGLCREAGCLEGDFFDSQLSPVNGRWRRIS
jgi:hypothetical protein